MFATDETLKAKKGIAWLIALAALMALIAIGLAVAFAFNSASELHSFAAQDDKEAIEAASSNKPTVTTTPDTTQITIAAIARPLPLFLPFKMPTMPTIPKIMPRIARKNEKLLMIGKNEVSSAMMPKTKPAMAIPDFDCGIGGIC